MSIAARHLAFLMLSQPLPSAARRLIDAFVEARLLSARTEAGAHNDVMIEVSRHGLDAASH